MHSLGGVQGVKHVGMVGACGWREQHGKVCVGHRGECMPGLGWGCQGQHVQSQCDMAGMLTVMPMWVRVLLA